MFGSREEGNCHRNLKGADKVAQGRSGAYASSTFNSCNQQSDKKALLSLRHHQELEYKA